MAHLSLLVLPRAVLPEALHHVQSVRVVLCLSVLRCQLAGHLSIEDITTMSHHHTTALEILLCAVLSLILALRIGAHLLNEDSLFHKYE